MKWKILAVGKPALAFARSGIGEYLPRARRYTGVEIDYLKAGPREETEAKMLQAAAGSVRLVLDERGENPTTENFVQWIDAWELASTKRVTVCIGGADGHSEEFRKGADRLISLSRLTLQHELALVVFLEQLYRAYTVKRGEPYHR